MAYAPQAQVYQRGMYSVIKTTSAPQALTPAVRAALASVDPAVPMYFAETVDAGKTKRWPCHGSRPVW